MGYAPGEFPHAEGIGARTVTLPLFPAMTDADVDRVCEAHLSRLTMHDRPRPLDRQIDDAARSPS